MALWVYVTHVLTMATLPLEKGSGIGTILANGTWPVAVFILLSGFVISNSATSRSYAAFITKRAFRIFPVYLVCLAVSVAILDISIEALHAAPWDMKRREDRLFYLEESQRNFWPHLALHIPMLHGLMPRSSLPASPYAFMGQAWSLTLEWQFYIIAPLIFGIAKNRKADLVHYVVLGALLWVSKKFEQGSFILSYLWLFYVGHLAYRALQNNSLGANTLITCALLTAFNKNIAPILIFYGTLLAATRKPKSKYIGILNGPTSKFLGKISYSFYCSHMAAIYLTAYILIVSAEISDRALYGVLLILSSLAVSIGASILLQRTIEQPGIAIGAKISKRFNNG